MIATVRRNQASPTSMMKTLSYSDNILARMEAEAAGQDEALMLNGRGEVACLTVANVFSLGEGGALFTPPPEAGILPGITRAKIIELSHEVGLTLVEQAQSAEEFFKGFTFASNSLMGMRAFYCPEQAQEQRTAPKSFLALQSAYDHLVKEKLR